MKDKEEFVKANGWTHHHGYKIDNSMICDEYDWTMVPMEEAGETLKECDFWMNEDGPCYEDIDDVIEWLDDQGIEFEGRE